MKILKFINEFVLKTLSDVVYFLFAVCVFRLMQYAFDEIDIFKFASYLFCITVVHEDFYDGLIDNVLFKLFPDVFEDDEDEETDFGDDEYILPNTFKAVYNNEKIDAYFELVSPELCGCFQFFLLKNIDRTCGEYLEIIGVKPPFKVKRNEIVIQQPDPYLVEFLDRNYDNGMFSFVRLVCDEYHWYYVYKVNFSKMKPYICGTLCDKELYFGIIEDLFSSTIDEITTDNGGK